MISAVSNGCNPALSSYGEQQKMLTENVEYMMGHGDGVAEHYFKPDMDLLLKDYLKAADVLTINNESQQQQEETKHEIIELRKQKDEQVKSLTDKVAFLEDRVIDVLEALGEMADKHDDRLVRVRMPIN